MRRSAIQPKRQAVMWRKKPKGQRRNESDDDRDDVDEIGSEDNKSNEGK